MLHIVRLFVLSLVCGLVPGDAAAQNRVAFVIGNDRYLEVAPLGKTVADAVAVAGRLTELGFRATRVTDAGRREMNLAVAEFAARLQPGDTALVFYAGHGVEIDGENYLLPADILVPTGVGAGHIEAESLALSRLLERIRATGARTTLALIDACRDNPFVARSGRSTGSARGLCRVAAPEGTFVVFSAGAGQQALDRLNEQDEGVNSVFTRSLLPRIGKPGLELRDLVSEVRLEARDLALSENHALFPACYHEPLGALYFSGGPGAAPQASLPGIVGCWAFSAECPLFVRTAGTITYRSSGGAGIVATWQDALGQTGTNRGTQSDRTFITRGPRRGRALHRDRHPQSRRAKLLLDEHARLQGACQPDVIGRDGIQIASAASAAPRSIAPS